MFHVAAVPRPFRDDDFAGSLTPAQLDDGGDNAGMRVDDLVAVVLDEVGLEDDALAGQRHALPECLILLLQHGRQVIVIATDRRDMDH
jgi:hypothetical protein